MNYFATAAGYRPNSQQQLKNIQFRSNSQLMYRLQIVSTALANSLNNYQIALKTQLAKKLASESEARSQKKVNSATIVIVVDQQAKTNKSQSIIIRPNQKISKSTQPDQKLISLPIQYPTTDETPIENNRKNINKKHTIYKHKKYNNYKINTVFDIPVPDVSMLIATQLPAFGLTMNELQLRRSCLRQRRVTEWNYSKKNRKDKRQIRLLHN